jgi:hypothetical protein
MSLNPPQDYRKTEFTHRAGLAADKPLATDVLPGTLYFSTDTGSLERSDGSTWSAYSSNVPVSLGASTLLGRGDSGAGAAEEITLSNSLLMTGTVLSVRTGIFNYTYNSTITTPPAAGQVRLDTVFASWNTATKVWMRFTSADGQDLYWGIMIVPTGSTLLIQDKDDHARYGRFLTTGTPIDSGLYAEIPVSWVASGTAILTAQQIFVRTSGT